MADSVQLEGIEEICMNRSFSWIIVFEKIKAKIGVITLKDEVCIEFILCVALPINLLKNPNSRLQKVVIYSFHY